MFKSWSTYRLSTGTLLRVGQLHLLYLTFRVRHIPFTHEWFQILEYILQGFRHERCWECKHHCTGNSGTFIILIRCISLRMELRRHYRVALPWYSLDAWHSYVLKIPEHLLWRVLLAFLDKPQDRNWGIPRHFKMWDASEWRYERTPASIGIHSCHIYPYATTGKGVQLSD